MKKVITVQETSKSLKLNQVLSILIFLIGALVMLVSPIGSLVLMLIGILWHIVTTTLIWWNHK